MERPRHQSETVFFAKPAADIVVIRIEGRGSNLNSPALQQVADRFFVENPTTRFVLDLEHCPAMDSTFMGAVAGITRRQGRAGCGKTIVVNVGEQARRLLEILGLCHVLEVRDGGPEVEAVVSTPNFKETGAPKMSKMERTIHMIQAHEELVNLDGGNVVKFEGVLQFLKESLERQQQGQ
ncbi:MAG: STAS domain-containing protein [Candidatus Sumerlaeota bacterium]|nr:STAS domain-containing protein [Candidatus Sumerlaeota bacterium]